MRDQHAYRRSRLRDIVYDSSQNRGPPFLCKTLAVSIEVSTVAERLTKTLVLDLSNIQACRSRCNRHIRHRKLEMKSTGVVPTTICQTASRVYCPARAIHPRGYLNRPPDDSYDQGLAKAPCYSSASALRQTSGSPSHTAASTPTFLSKRPSIVSRCSSLQRSCNSINFIFSAASAYHSNTSTSPHACPSRGHHAFTGHPFCADALLEPR